MKRGILFCMCTLFPTVAGADYLDDKIATLTQQKLDKIAELEKCQKSSKGLKIAGITTLGVSTIGIAANIGEAVALNKTEDKIDAAQKKSSDLDSQIEAAKEEARKKAEEEARKKAEEEKEVEEEVEISEIEKCLEAKDCPAGCDGQLATLSAKTAVCLGESCVATECADGVTATEKKCLNENGQEFVYYECEAPEEQIDDDSAEEGSENGSTERKHHEDCSADETAKIAGAASSWWSGSMKKCVAKSCKDGWFLTMKGNSSQGVCRNECPKSQVVKGPNGGQGCNIAQNKTCDSKVLENFKNSNSAESVECDKTTGKPVIKKCKSGFTEQKSNGKIEKCVKVEEKKVCKSDQLYLEIFQDKDDDEFLYSSESVYSALKDETRTIQTVKGGFVYECDDEYCDRDTIVTMSAGHVFKGKKVSQKRMYMCSTAVNDEWRLVDPNPKKCDNAAIKKLKELNYTVYEYGGYYVWNHDINDEYISACIK